jgi:hypothetical protein
MRCFSLFRDTWRNIATSLILNICWKKSIEPNRINLRSVFITNILWVGPRSDFGGNSGGRGKNFRGGAAVKQCRFCPSLQLLQSFFRNIALKGYLTQRWMLITVSILLKQCRFCPSLQLLQSFFQNIALKGYLTQRWMPITVSILQKIFKTENFCPPIAFYKIFLRYIIGLNSQTVVGKWGKPTSTPRAYSKRGEEIPAVR